MFRFSTSPTTWTCPVRPCVEPCDGGQDPALGRPELGGTSSLILRDVPEPFAVATPPADFQQGLGLGVHVQDALAALGLGKKGRDVSVSLTAKNEQGGPAGFELMTVRPLLLPQGKHHGGSGALADVLPTPGCHRWEVMGCRGPKNSSLQNQGTRRKPTFLIVGGPRFPPQTGPVSRQVHFTKRHRPQQDSQPCCAPPSISVRQQLWDQV